MTLKICMTAVEWFYSTSNPPWMRSQVCRVICLQLKSLHDKTLQNNCLNKNKTTKQKTTELILKDCESSSP